MDIKELVEYGAEKIYFYKYGYELKEVVPEIANECRKEAKQILSHSNLALVIRDGDEVPLGVEVETHHVVLLKKALKEVKDE